MINPASQFHFHQTDPASAVISDRGVKIAEIRDLKLCQARFQPDGPVIIAETVPMPLFWWQYQNHQDPERSAGCYGKINLIRAAAQEIVFTCTSINASGSVVSRYRVQLTYSPQQQSYVFRILARLSIPDSCTWQVSRNPAHGEVEFCNLWPSGSFSADVNAPKRYQYCCIQRQDGVIRIPHHHLETSDKHNIEMRQGDRLLWLLEDVNPVVELVSGDPVAAGICAYMWDGHFGYRVTRPDQPEIDLENKRNFAAEFQLYTLNRTAGAEWLAQSRELVPKDLHKIPIYVNGLNTFAHTVLDFPDRLTQIWPWSHEIAPDSPDSAIFTWDREIGFDDHFSLRIENHESGTARWLATALGPAFGQAPFPDGARYRLSGYIKTENLTGAAILAIRLHRSGQGDLFRPETYERFASAGSIHGTCDWQKVVVVTPPISPPPDRLHLLLQQCGRGKSWFDNVLLEVLT